MFQKGEQPFEPSLSEVERRKIYLSRMGINVEEISRMRDLFRADLDTKEFGIVWWKSKSKKQKQCSVLAADYLFQVSESILENLVEAHVHYNEFKRTNRKPNIFVSEKELRSNRSVSTFSRRDNLSDFYQDDLSKSHLIGLFRGIGSVIDCWLATFILASGIKAPIWECKLRNLYERKKELNGSDLSTSDLHEVASIEKFLKVLDSHSPNGWGPWVESLRNMYVHKGRLRTLSMATPKPSAIHSAHGEDLYSVQITTFLPRHPELSEVESLLATSKIELMHFGVDIEMFCDESITIINEISKHLALSIVDIWNERKQGVEDIQQFPIEQWPKLKQPRLTYKGSTNGSLSQPREMYLAEEAALRMWAAGLDDRDRDFWLS